MPVEVSLSLCTRFSWPAQYASQQEKTSADKLRMLFLTLCVGVGDARNAVRWTTIGEQAGNGLQQPASLSRQVSTGVPTVGTSRVENQDSAAQAPIEAVLACGPCACCARHCQMRCYSSRTAQFSRARSLQGVGFARSWHTYLSPALACHRPCPCLVCSMCRLLQVGVLLLRSQVMHFVSSELASLDSLIACAQALFKSCWGVGMPLPQLMSGAALQTCQRPNLKLTLLYYAGCIHSLKAWNHCLFCVRDVPPFGAVPC